MPRALTVEQILDQLVALKDNPSAPDATEQLTKGLAHKTNLVAAKAANVAEALKRTDMIPGLELMFRRFMENVGADKGCSAKLAAAKALDVLEADAPDVFLAGAKHVQREPAWGGSVDVAAGMRGVCAIALARTRHPEAMHVLTELLIDPEAEARVAAARALAYDGRYEGALLLRLKLRAGDTSDDVTGECFGALVRIAPAKAVPFVAGFLHAADESTRNAATLALGESRQPAALEMLRHHWTTHLDPRGRPVLLLAAAMLRLPDAVAWLLSLVEDADARTAADAIEAMRLYRHDEVVAGKVRAIVERRGESPMWAALEKAFG